MTPPNGRKLMRFRSEIPNNTTFCHILFNGLITLTFCRRFSFWRRFQLMKKHQHNCRNMKRGMATVRYPYLTDSRLLVHTHTTTHSHFNSCTSSNVAQLSIIYHLSTLVARCNSHGIFLSRQIVSLLSNCLSSFAPQALVVYFCVHIVLLLFFLLLLSNCHLSNS
jgi:hypothetical protein